MVAKVKSAKRKLEKEITGMKLKSFDDKSVDVFIRTLGPQCLTLTAGGEVEAVSQNTGGEQIIRDDRPTDHSPE
ncbi:hypothetical protein TYRP_013991 [Tyrophagus putrescentiae]|nr:hypothetical protein TYRP_013991 [Tyrophagus putrescentiae]